MKSVTVYSGIFGTNKNKNSTLIDPDMDLLNRGNDDLYSFTAGEIVHCVVNETSEETTATVIDVHIDNYGVLVELDVDWKNRVPQAS